MKEQFSIQTEEGARDGKNREITEVKLDTARLSGDLLSVGELKLEVLEIVKDERGLHFSVIYDPAKQTRTR